MGLVVAIDDLPPAPLDAAHQFHAVHVPRIRDELGDGPGANLVLAFAAAGPEHRAWRLAAIQELAREWAPRRANAVAGGDGPAREAAIAFLDENPGITGQLLILENG